MQSSEKQIKRLIIFDEAQFFGKTSDWSFVFEIIKKIGLPGIYLPLHMLSSRNIFNKYRQGKLSPLNFPQDLRKILGVSIERISDDTIMKCWYETAQGCDDNAIKRTSKSLDDLFIFLTDETNYCIVFVNKTDPITHGNFDIENRLYTDDSNVLILNSYSEGSLNKQNMAEKAILIISNCFKERNIILDAVISFDQDISVSAKEKLFKHQEWLNESVDCIDCHTNNDIIKPLYKIHYELDKKQTTRRYKTLKLTLEHQHDINKRTIEYTHAVKEYVPKLMNLSDITNNTQTVFVLLSEAQAFGSIVKMTHRIQSHIGTRVFLAIYEFFKNETHYEKIKNNVISNQINFWPSIKESIDVHHDMPQDVLREFWDELLVLNAKDKLVLRQFIEFIVNNQNYHVLLMSKPNLKEVDYYDNYALSSESRCANLINRVHIIKSEKSYSNRLHAVAQEIRKFFDHDTRVHNIVSIHRTITAAEIKKELCDAPTFDQMHFLDKPQGVKHLNYLPGSNNVALIKLLVEIDYEINKRYLKTQENFELDAIEHNRKNKLATIDPSNKKQTNDEEEKASPSFVNFIAKKQQGKKSEIPLLNP